MVVRWVLLVSEDAAFLDSIEGCLEGSGLRVATSPNPSHGASQARDLHPALIITDVRFDADVPLMLVRRTVKLTRLRKQVDDLLNPPPPPVPEPFLGGGIKISPPPRRGRRWILLLNEDPALEATVEEALSGSGLHLTTASTAGQAAIQARELRPVLIVSDFPEGGPLTELRREPAVGSTPFISVRPPFDPVRIKTLALQLMAAASGEAL